MLLDSSRCSWWCCGVIGPLQVSYCKGCFDLLVHLPQVCKAQEAHRVECVALRCQSQDNSRDPVPLRCRLSDSSVSKLLSNPVIPMMSPSSVEQRVLESFLLEMDVSDFDPETRKRGKTVKTKRKAETPVHSSTKKPKLSWERRKADLPRLRAEVETLQTRKMLLELRRIDGNDAVGMSFCDQSQWRDVAKMKEQRFRQVSEENTLLKRKLQHFVHVYDGLKTLVDVSQTKVRIIRALRDQTRIECQHNHIAGLKVFNMLECRMNKRLEDLGAIHVASSARIIGTDVDQVQVHRGGDVQEATALEFKRSRLLPFTTSVTADTVWNVMKLGVISNERCARVYIRSEDLLASHGCFTHELDDGGSVEIRSCCLMKRVEIPEGTIVLVESITEWLVSPSCSSAWSHMTRDSGWVAVRPVASSISTSGMCQLQSTIRLQTNKRVKTTPSYIQKDSVLLARSVSDVMVASFRSILNSRHQLVDNALLDST